MTETSPSQSTDLPDLAELWDYHDPAATETRFREVESTLDEAAPLGYRLQLQTQIARTYSLRSMFDEAHSTLDAIEAEVAEAPVAKVRWHLERGRTFRSAGDREPAREHFLAAIEEASPLASAGDPAAEYHLVDAMHMMGLASDTEEAQQWNLKALAAAQAADDPKASRWQGSLLNNIGWTYFDAGDVDEAQRHLDDALVWFEANGKPRQIRIARYSVARVWRERGLHEKALAEQLAVHELSLEAGAADPYVQEEIGWNLVALGRADDARPHLQAALEALADDGWTAENEPKRLERLREQLAK